MISQTLLHRAPRRLEATVGTPPGAVVREGAAAPRLLGVMLGGFDPHFAIGLEVTLRRNLRLRVFPAELESGAVSQPVAQRVPHLAILDEALPRSTAPRPIAPRGGIVVLAREPSLLYGGLLLAAGLSCLHYGHSPETLLDAVRCAARGGCVFVSGDGDRIERENRSPESWLTERRIEVLERLSKGRSYIKIARELKISPRTAEGHTESLVACLQASSKRELVGLPTGWLKWDRASREAGMHSEGGAD